MRILIVGAGVVGFNLAEELSREGHDISIIDQDKKKTQHLADSLDVLTINGNACMPSVLERAFGSSMPIPKHLIYAVMSNLENLLPGGNGQDNRF